MLTRIRNFYLTPSQYFIIASVALASLVLIVMTGSAVRLTGSGLGCPDWPKCYGGTIPPADVNAIIEYGNRLLTGFVGLAVIAASVLAWRRRPFRWHLAALGALLPLGVIGQAALGAAVVESHLAPELVMCHFILSMMLLDAAFALMWLSRYETDARRRSKDRLGVWAVRALIPIGQLTIVLGTMSTAAGPHPGEHKGDIVRRFDFQGGETLQWLVARHSAIAAAFGLAAVATFFILRRTGGDRRATRPLLALVGLLALQGAVGAIQWSLELPAAIVWVHVVLATFTWVAVLWTVATAGLLESRRDALGAQASELSAPATSQGAPEAAGVS
jgi:cytochrome c oxidase assembly protein subunit 15